MRAAADAEEAALDSVRTFGDGVTVPRVQQGALSRPWAYPEGMGSEEHACPSCGQPVELVVRRRKTLGAWVPSWVKGPCQNPRCTAYVPPDHTDTAPAEPAEPHADPSPTDGPAAPQNP